MIAPRCSEGSIAVDGPHDPEQLVMGGLVMQSDFIHHPVDLGIWGQVATQGQYVDCQPAKNRDVRPDQLVTPRGRHFWLCSYQVLQTVPGDVNQDIYGLRIGVLLMGLDGAPPVAVWVPVSSCGLPGAKRVMPGSE